MSKVIDDAIKNAGLQGRAPEQEDFLTAAVQNFQTLSAREKEWLQRDLAAAESGTSSESILGRYVQQYEEEYDDYGYYDSDFEICEGCGSVNIACICDDLADEGVALHGFCEKYAWCETSRRFNIKDIETQKKLLSEQHKKECDCGTELIFEILE